METIKTFNGIALIDKIIEFIALTPNEMEWNYTSLSSNKPRLVRLKRINALLKAFSLTTRKNVFKKAANYLNPDVRADIKSVLNGDFIKNRDIEEYNELTNFVKQALQESDSGIDGPISLNELSFVYPKMIKYKIKLREIIGFNSGWLEVSLPFSIFHVQLTDSISSNLINKYDDLNHVIELIINPGKLLFTETELIEKFGFPTEDLHQIDLENY